MSKLNRSGSVFLGAWLAVVLVGCSSDSSSPGTENAAGAGGTGATTTPDGGSSQAGNTAAPMEASVSSEAGAGSDEAAVTLPMDATTLGDALVAPGDSG